MICLGANGVFTGKLILQMAGCVGNEHGRCNACNTGLCPAGITTQEPALVRRLDPEQVAQNIVNYFLAMDQELRSSWPRSATRRCRSAAPTALVATDTGRGGAVCRSSTSVNGGS